MEQMTVTAKIQISVNADSKVLLDKTMSVYSDACNYVSDYVFRTHDLKQFSLNKALYSTLREKFGLKSQMAQSVFKTVIARYKTILENQKEWIQPSFKKPQYDLVWNRDYSLTQNCFSVNTLNGRVKLPYFTEGMAKYFNHDIYKFGTAKLINKHGKYFLHIPVTYDVEESNDSDICNVVGIDRGLRFIATTYDENGKTKFVSGKSVMKKRDKFAQVRAELQSRGTKSAKRRLKALSGRENRWMSDINHQISKTLVNDYGENTLFVVEDLTGVSFDEANLSKDAKANNQLRTWSFYQLEQFLSYKAAGRQSKVIKVDPDYTSQRCPKCGRILKENRNHKTHEYVCDCCGYRSNDDRVGAMNIQLLGTMYVSGDSNPRFGSRKQ